MLSVPSQIVRKRKVKQELRYMLNTLVYSEHQLRWTANAALRDFNTDLALLFDLDPDKVSNQYGTVSYPGCILCCVIFVYALAAYEQIFQLRALPHTLLMRY
jgi:hypothetical protein